MFSVRGDGLTTVSTDKTEVSAFVATASVADYVGTVMEVQTTGTAAGSGFKLFHVGDGWGVGELCRGCWCEWGIGVGGGSLSARCLGELPACIVAGGVDYVVMRGRACGAGAHAVVGVFVRGAGRRRDDASGDGRYHDRDVGVSNGCGIHEGGDSCVNDQSGSYRFLSSQGACCCCTLSRCSTYGSVTLNGPC